MLPEAQVVELLAAARRAREQAYCPYSGYAVGAAVLDSAGVIHTGCNVENVSFGLTICAERNATAASVAAGMRPGELLGLALVAGPQNASTEGRSGWPAVPTPCGACLQVLAEFAGQECAVICARLDADGEVVVRHLSELLPQVFGGHPPA